MAALLAQPLYPVFDCRQSPTFVGASDVPPIVANYDILYVRSKGSAIRDLAFISTSILSPEPISRPSPATCSSYTIDEWCWAEQPFYNVNAIRNDGTLLIPTFLKEQEFVGWSHYVTNGAFNSTASVTEPTDHAGTIDAVYVAVERTINGNTVQYIERFAERAFPSRCRGRLVRGRWAGLRRLAGDQFHRG